MVQISLYLQNVSRLTSCCRRCTCYSVGWDFDLLRLLVVVSCISRCWRYSADAFSLFCVGSWCIRVLLLALTLHRENLIAPRMDKESLPIETDTPY